MVSTRLKGARVFNGGEIFTSRPSFFPFQSGSGKEASTNKTEQTIRKTSFLLISILLYMGLALLASSSAFVTRPLLSQLVRFSPIGFNYIVGRFKPFTCISHYNTTTSPKMTSNFKTFDLDFLKPDLDERSYRFIELPNKLKALLIQDPKADKAAASLDVNIGAFEDPESLPGLAHFCEHLLFMGSEKFPDENEYSSYLSKHGGSSNAYTASQNTNYFFEINHQHLFGALDRFAGFFSCPLFNKDSTDKEINAVNSENKKNYKMISGESTN